LLYLKNYSTIIIPKGFSYSKEEVDSFLDTVEEYLPISLTAWERVAEIHLMWYPNLNWTINSLKRKFKELHSNKKSHRRSSLSPCCLPGKAFAG
jgi:hypothetical protein